ncbi:Cation channel sperm-associated protein 1 (CatSper1), partial [Durusdinium trenchii]
MPRPASGARSGLEGFKEALHALRTQQEQSLAAIEALLETCEAESTVATVALKPDQDFDNNEKEEESSPTPCIEYDAAKSRNVHVQNVHALSEQGSKFKDLITDDEEDAYNTKTLSGMCRYLVSKPQFDWAMGVIILLNSICIGIETQRTVQPDLFVDWPSEVLDMTFVVIYVIEICMRLLAFGCANFRDGWFLFDFALVGMGVVGNVVVPIMNVSETEGDSPIAKVLVVRSLRLLRLVRAIRMLHMFRTVWRLVYGLLTSWNAIISTFFILLLTLYIFACLGVEVITRDSTLAADPSTAWIVEYHFGSLHRTMLTLFSFVSADSISAVYMPIVIVRPEYIIYFVAVILTVSVALMNLVTAVLVEGALANAANDKELSRHDMKQKAEMGGRGLKALGT